MPLVLSKNFFVLEDSSNRFISIVFASSYLRLFDSLEEIEATLSSLNKSGYVLFDQLASNGRTSNRLVSDYFDGHRIHLSSLGPIMEYSLLALCDGLIIDNHKLLSSVLPECSQFISGKLPSKDI